MSFVMVNKLYLVQNDVKYPLMVSLVLLHFYVFEFDTIQCRGRVDGRCVCVTSCLSCDQISYEIGNTDVLA